MNNFLDIYVVQTVPPSCINRDEMGRPKSAPFGGVRRARVSSQAWKYAIRKDFQNLFRKEDLGIRTKNVVELLENEMIKLGCDLEDKARHELAIKTLKAAGVLSEKKDKEKESKKSKAKEKADTDEAAAETKDTKKKKEEKEEKNDTLFFTNMTQIRALAKHALTLNISDKESKKILRQDMIDNPSVDHALFGRMAASEPMLNYDAAVQIANALSTHAVDNEYDYFIAADDYPCDKTGAAHIGSSEFCSATLYRYANVNLSTLAKSIGEENVAEVVQKFVKAFITSMPTGKMNSYGNRTLPNAVYVTIRDDQPINLENAFEAPIPESDNGYANESVQRLIDFSETVYANFADRPVKAFCVGTDFGGHATRVTLNELLEEIVKYL